MGVGLLRWRLPVCGKSSPCRHPDKDLGIRLGSVAALIRVATVSVRAGVSGGAVLEKWSSKRWQSPQTVIILRVRYIVVLFSRYGCAYVGLPSKVKRGVVLGWGVANGWMDHGWKLYCIVLYLLEVGCCKRMDGSWMEVVRKKKRIWWLELTVQ